jgi:leader peptidase (prepilin peptidase)/N-methyltransferase
MQFLLLLSENPEILILFVTVLGLLVGSFLNVVIYRLPVMMQTAWRAECHEYLHLTDNNPIKETISLIFPASRCPHCQTQIKPWHNIPVISYLLLKGRCAYCGVNIAWRYPAIEALTGLLSAITAFHFGYGLALLFALLLTWSLVALTFIDIDHYLLPDSIVLPLVWLGLLLSLHPVFVDSHTSIIGAAVGYLSLWSVYHLFKLLTGKEGMGYGDFKLLAVFGAWLGYQYIILIILLSSLVGAIIGISLIVIGKNERNKPIPFGPYLAAAGWLALLWGKEMNHWYLNLLGL